MRFRRAARGRCPQGEVAEFTARNPGSSMPSAFAHAATSTPRVRGHGLWLAAVLTCLSAGSVLAADAALNWASLSGDQQYILARFSARWAQLDLAARQGLLARAETHRLQTHNATSQTATAAPANKPAVPRQSSRRRRSLSAAEAGMSAHSFRLRRVLRDLPGLSINERRNLLERWGGLSNSERVKLVDRYMRNVDDDEELSLQQALRDGRLSNAELQRGLASGKLLGSEVKAALADGRLSTETIKDGVASRAIVAEDLEKGMRDGNIESSDLSNAIEHNRTPDRDALPASANTLPP